MDGMEYPPQKSYIETTNGHFLKGVTFCKALFWVSMLVFVGVYPPWNEEFAPENGGLEDDPFLLGSHFFQGRTLSSRQDKWYCWWLKSHTTTWGVYPYNIPSKLRDVIYYIYQQPPPVEKMGVIVVPCSASMHDCLWKWRCPMLKLSLNSDMLMKWTIDTVQCLNWQDFGYTPEV